jgi:hypothetical protein
VSAPILDSRQPDLTSADPTSADPTSADPTSADPTSADLAPAVEILARLERYAAAHRSETPTAEASPEPEPEPITAATLAYRDFTLDVLPSKTHKNRFDPSTIDLFPYDLSAAIIGCALTILAYVSFGLPVAVVITAALVVGGESARRRRWFPSLGLNLVIGTIIGLLFVFTA